MWLLVRLSWERLWLSCKSCLGRWSYLALMGQLLSNADRLLCRDTWTWCYRDPCCDMRQWRLDLGLEGSSGLDKVRLSDTSGSHDPCMELRRRVTSLGLSLVGIHSVGQLLGYYRGRLSSTSLVCCCRESERSHWFLHVSPTNNLLG